MRIPVLTNELAHRIEQADLDVMQGRLKSALQREGNPLGVQFRQFGGATALLTPGIPIIDFNKVLMFGPEQLTDLDEIIAFYEENGRDEFGITVIPARTSPELLQAMHERGMYQYGFHAAFYGVPDLEQITPNDRVTVRPIEEHEVGVLSEIFIKSFSVPPFRLTDETEANRILFREPNWRMYLAFVDGTPAGFATMHVRDGVACLALAGTLPEWRGLGCQNALLQQRIVDAKQMGCHLLVAQASYGSASFRNMQKQGLQIAFTQAEWKWKKNL